MKLESGYMSYGYTDLAIEIDQALTVWVSLQKETIKLRDGFVRGVCPERAQRSIRSLNMYSIMKHVVF